MVTRWTTNESGQVIFEPRPPMQARLIVGAMLSFFALFFGYYLFSGLLEYIRLATAREWLGMIPGSLVLLILFLLFAVPAWAAFVGRSKVIVDVGRGSITDVFDFRIYRRTRSYAVDQVKAVTIREQTFRSKSRTNVSHAVQILLRNEKTITVAHEDEIEDARKLATQVASSFRTIPIPVIESARDEDDTEA